MKMARAFGIKSCSFIRLVFIIFQFFFRCDLLGQAGSRCPLGGGRWGCVCRQALEMEGLMQEIREF